MAIHLGVALSEQRAEGREGENRIIPFPVVGGRMMGEVSELQEVPPNGIGALGLGPQLLGV